MCLDKLYTLLYTLNNLKIKSQRDLSEKTGMSLGMINSLLKNMKSEGYITLISGKSGDNKAYKLTAKGQEFLENMLKENQDRRIILPESENKAIRSSVILAGGEREDFSIPVGLLTIEGMTIIDRIVNSLLANSVEKIYVITGFKSELYSEHFKGNEAIKIIKNERYKWTGTMYSLSLAAPYIDDDFLIVESDQIFEGRAIREIINCDRQSVVLISNASGSHDEAFVELNDDGSIYKISKDKHQVNSMDYEMLGISKISKLMFDKMLDNYKIKENPYMNYEYIIENISRLFKVFTIEIDNLCWCEVDNKEHFSIAINKIYPELCRREQKEQEKIALKTVKDIMGLSDNMIKKFSFAGGMTNTNFLVKLENASYILRMPGACTQTMISRKNERYNSKLATLMGLNPEMIYFNGKSGVKISEFIENAETLNPTTAKQESNMMLITDILKKLHNSKFEFQNDFNVFLEYQKYKSIADKSKINYYKDFNKAEEFFFYLEGEINKIGMNMKPCHIDTVPENFIKDKNGRLYLIDWEYSGMNDPMWDVAAHILESSFNEAEEELFLSYYFNGEISKTDEQKIMIFKICQDMLWALWTLIKEASGEDFGGYGQSRFNRCLRLMNEYGAMYE